MKNGFILTLFLVIGIASCPILSAQNSYPSELTLEDIYKNRIFNQKGINSLRWMKGNQGYSTLEDNKGIGGKDIVRYDAKSGNREVLVPAGKFIPHGSTEPLPISDYTWSRNNDKLLIFTNTRQVWRYHTRGDYWVLDLQSGRLQQLGSEMDPARLMFAKFSPDATKAGYVYRNNIIYMWKNWHPAGSPG